MINMGQIISSAALLNALELMEIQNAKIIVSGAWVCGNGLRQFVYFTWCDTSITMFDKDGVLSEDRTDLSLLHNINTPLEKQTTLAEAIKC
jgi:malate dehydrogenase (oxaloacetate-decarboxylating)(NADP+)